MSDNIICRCTAAERTIEMGEKNIKNKQVKKKKKAAISADSHVSPIKTVVAQPELIKKKKKPL